MYRVYEENRDNVERNRLTIIGCGTAYNAILDVDRQAAAGIDDDMLSLVKLHLHIPESITDHDEYLKSILIPACRGAVETYTGLSIVPQTITAILRNELGNIELPYGPVLEITSVQNRNDEEVTDYKVNGGQFKRIETSGDWFQVIYEAGYETIPSELQMAILQEVAYRFENRGDQGKSDLSDGAKSYASRYRRVETWLP